MVSTVRIGYYYNMSRRILWPFLSVFIVLCAGWLAQCADVPGAILVEGQGILDSLTPVPSQMPDSTPVDAPPESRPAVALPIFVPPPVKVPPTFTPVPQPTAAPAFSICSPLQGDALDELSRIISDPYHPPPKGSDERHQGVDFAYYRHKERQSIQGVPVQSALAGRVAARIMDSFPFGNVLMIETPGDILAPDLAVELGLESGESLYLFYGHLESISSLQLGEAVSACQPVAAVGKSGNVGAPHLHFETRIGPAGQTFTSFSYYLAKNTPEERENYRLWRTSGVFRHFDPMRLLLYGLQP